MKKQLQHILGFRWLLISVIIVGSPSTRLQAAIYSFQSSLDPVQAGVPGTGGGFATLTLDDVSGLVTLTSGSFSNLSSTTTAAHIHGLAAPGVGAGVLIGLTIPLGATSGTISGSGTLNAAGIAGMLNGLTYVNIHTSTFGGGEIRGQNLLVPEPGSFALAGLGGLILARFVRKQKCIS